MNKLTQERLKEILHYNSDTGVFTRLVSSTNRVKVGDMAGSLKKDGYLTITIKTDAYLAHRLAWLYIYGYFPEYGIDHINRNPSDNRIINLREVSQTCNTRNCGNRKHNTSGVKGVGWHKQSKKWRARIDVFKIQKNLGCYANFQEAVCARLAAEQCVNWSGCDANSPAFQYVKNNINGDLK